MNLDEANCCIPPSPQSGQSSNDQEPYETDHKRLVARQKQVDYGKNTEGYQRYISAVPRDKRRQYGRNMHPRTPDITLKTSKRAWDGMVRAWRRHLHKYDTELESSHSSSVTGIEPHNILSPSHSATEAGGNHKKAPCNVSYPGPIKIASHQNSLTSRAAPGASTAWYTKRNIDQACNVVNLHQTMNDAPASNRMQPSAAKPKDQAASPRTGTAPATKTASKRLPLTNRTNHQENSVTYKKPQHPQRAVVSRTRRTDQCSKYPQPSLSVSSQDACSTHVHCSQEDCQALPCQLSSSPLHMPRTAGVTSTSAAFAQQPSLQVSGWHEPKAKEPPAHGVKQYKPPVTTHSKPTKPTAAIYKPPFLRLPAAAADAPSTPGRTTYIACNQATVSASSVIGTDQLPSHVSEIILRRRAASYPAAAFVAAQDAVRAYPLPKIAAGLGCSLDTGSYCLVCGEESTIVLMPCKHKALCGACSQQYILAAQCWVGNSGNHGGKLGYCPACRQAVQHHVAQSANMAHLGG